MDNKHWEFFGPYLGLIREDAAQRVHAMRDVFDATRWMVKAGYPWRMLPGDFPLWQAVKQQSKRWMKAGYFGAMVHDLRKLLRLLAERKFSVPNVRPWSEPQGRQQHRVSSELTVTNFFLISDAGRLCLRSKHRRPASEVYFNWEPSE